MHLSSLCFFVVAVSTANIIDRKVTVKNSAACFCQAIIIFMRFALQKNTFHRLVSVLAPMASHINETPCNKLQLSTTHNHYTTTIMVAASLCAA